MSNNVFPEITFQDGKWFLRYVSGVNDTEKVLLPDDRIMNMIWSAACKVLACQVDDCGEKPTECVKTLREASKNFAGIAQILADQANDLELDLLYAPDPDEKWYNK